MPPRPSSRPGSCGLPPPGTSKEDASQNLKHPSGSMQTSAKVQPSTKVQPSKLPPNQARKAPRQARSKATVEAILEATARVLIEGGYAALTTTKVAEEAGVGVGTLYQYFPAKEALVMALLQANLARIEKTIEDAVRGSEGTSLEAHTEALIDALLVAKRARPELSAALRRQLPAVEGEQVVRAAMKRMRAQVRALLALHARELPGADLDLVATVLTTAVEGAITAAVDLSPSLVRKKEFGAALHALVRGYLRESGWRPAKSR